MIWVWRATVEWYWQGKTEELGEKPVPVPLCPPQIPYGLTRARTRASAVRGRRLTTWAMARPTKSVLVIFKHSVLTSNKTRTHKHNKDQLVTSVKEIIPVYSEIRNFVLKTQNYWLLQQVVQKGDCLHASGRFYNFFPFLQLYTLTRWGRHASKPTCRWIISRVYTMQVDSHEPNAGDARPDVSCKQNNGSSNLSNFP
jgi:hypothetical protein